MKDFLDKITDSIKHTCKEVTDQAEKTVDQTKYRKDLIALKAEIKKLYYRLGEEYYDSYTKGEEMQLAPICNRITALQKEVEKIEKSIKEVVIEQKDSFSSFKRGVMTTWNEEDDDYNVARNEEGIQLMKFCHKCNVGNNIDATYCINCGTKFE